MLKESYRINKRSGYFYRVRARTQTQFWINSAVQVDLEFGLREGAVGITTNPTHPPRAIKTDRQIWQPVIDEILKANPEITDDEVADEITQQMAARSAGMLWPIYKQSDGKYGYVAIQGNPFTNEDLPKVLAEAKRYSKLGKNIAVKIQSTAVGAKAVEELTALGVNTICTKGFSVAQAIYMAEAYERGLKRTDASPKCFVVNIPGVFDEYLAEVAEAQGLDVSAECLFHAGAIITRRVYHIMHQRGYKAHLLAGGSRAPHHFAELVGGDLAITISISDASRLVETNPPVISRIEAGPPPDIMEELEDKFPDFQHAYYEDGLAPDEFFAFGPCMKFQKSCEKGYLATLEEVKARRVACGFIR